MRVDRIGVLWTLLPHPRDRSREQPKHPTHSLELAEGRYLLGQRAHQFGMEGIALRQHFDATLPRGCPRQAFPVVTPELSVRVDHRCGSNVVDRLEQSPPEHEYRLVVLCGVKHGRLPRRNALKLVHDRGELQVLARIGIARLPVFSDGKGIDESHVVSAFDGLEERAEERRQLVRHPWLTLDLP